jgi:hypothetical protein
MQARVAVQRELAPIVVEGLIKTFGRPKILRDLDEPTILTVEFTIPDDMREAFSKAWAKLKNPTPPPKTEIRAFRGIGNLTFYQILPQHIHSPF